MNFIIILISTSIAWVFMYKIKWLYDFGVFFGVLLIYCLLLFGLSFLLLELNYSNPYFFAFLRMPIISIVIFKILHVIFKKVYKRDPENTAWVFEKKPIQDVIFSILFWLLGVVLPFIIVSI